MDHVDPLMIIKTGEFPYCHRVKIVGCEILSLVTHEVGGRDKSLWEKDTCRLCNVCKRRNWYTVVEQFSFHRFQTIYLQHICSNKASRNRYKLLVTPILSICVSEKTGTLANFCGSAARAKQPLACAALSHNFAAIAAPKESDLCPPLVLHLSSRRWHRDETSTSMEGFNSLFFPSKLQTVTQTHTQRHIIYVLYIYWPPLYASEWELDWDYWVWFPQWLKWSPKLWYIIGVPSSDSIRCLKT